MIGMSYEASGLVPSIFPQDGTFENVIYWGRFENIIYSPGEVIDAATADLGNTPTDVLRAGMLLGRVASSNKWKQWAPTATDGTQIIRGVLLRDLKMNVNGTGYDRYIGPIMLAGKVKASAIFRSVASGDPGDFVGDDYEYLARAQMCQFGRFQFDDNPVGINGDGWIAIRALINTSSPYTLTEADSNTLFHTLGSGGAITVNLPAPKPGLMFGFLNAVDEDLTIAPASANQFIIDNDASGDSFALTVSGGQIGHGVKFYGISTSKYIVIPIGPTIVKKGAHIADAKVDYTTGDLDTEAKLITAFNTTNGKINSILAVLEAANIMAST